MRDWLGGTGRSAGSAKAADDEAKARKVAEEAKRQQDIAETVRPLAQGIDPGGDR